MVTGLERCTPNYVVMEGTKRNKMRLRTARLAMDFEEKARYGQGQRRWIEECIKKREERRFLTKKMLEGDEYLRRCGVREEELEQWREQGRFVAVEISRCGRGLQIREQEILIEGARYNRRYKRIKVKGYQNT